ncbi:MAG: hypothetical protein LBH36_00175 [Candidatus Nomurabacteria bacterium]|jgi:hypothetical protein|nr:hypothetical protein [Candidatus Nomurabacteria bacterium]
MANNRLGKMKLFLEVKKMEGCIGIGPNTLITQEVFLTIKETLEKLELAELREKDKASFIVWDPQPSEYTRCSGTSRCRQSSLFYYQEGGIRTAILEHHRELFADVMRLSSRGDQYDSSSMMAFIRTVGVLVTYVAMLNGGDGETVSMILNEINNN